MSKENERYLKMRIDLPQCDFSNCRRRFDGNCNSKEAFRYCPYQQLKTSKTIDVVRVCPECGDWEALYINGVLASEGHEVRLDSAIMSLGQFAPILYGYLEIPDEAAEKGMPKYLDDLGK